MKVLNETYVTEDISINKLDRLVNNITANNSIFFNDDEIPPRGRGSTKALYVTTRCKGYTLPGVLIDNGSALNVLPLSTLNRLPLDSSHMKPCQNIVRAFDGTERGVIGRIEIPLLIDPNTYEVDFLVMDIKPSYNCLLGRPWIHSAGAVPSTLHQKLKLVTEGQLVTINAEEDIIATVTSNALYLEANDEAIECSFRSLEIVNATFIVEGNKVLTPKISKTTKMGLRLTVGKGAILGKGLERYLQGKVEVPLLKDKRDRFGLRFKPDARQRKKELEKKQERRRARLSGKEIKWKPMIFPHISKTFVFGGIIHPGQGTLENSYINATSKERTRRRNLSPDINDTNLLRMVKQEEKKILPHEETVEVVALEEGKEVKIGTCITKEMRQDLVDLLQEFKDVFAWSYQDMPGLSIDIVVHRLPIKEDCKPVQQKLRRMRPDMILKIKEEVKKQFHVDYRDLNKASPKDNFPLPYIDTLVDNMASYSLFFFMDGFSGYNQIKMHPEDMDKTTFVTMWGTFCYKVMPFGLKNAGATYQRAMVTLFYDMMHKKIEVYVDDMITKPRTEKEHVQVLRKFQLKLNPTKCTFGARSGKLLGFVVSEKGIEVDLDKVKAIQELPPPRTQKEVRGKKEQAIYYLSKKFIECETRYSPIEKLCCALVWTTQRLRQYMLYHTTWLISKLDPLKYMMESTALNGRMARWQILLSEFDIVYVNQKALKRSAIANFLASKALEDYEPLDFDFPNEDLMYVATTEESTLEDRPWKLNFDRASNVVGNGIGAILVSPNGDHYPFTCKLDFDCTNNMEEYEACIMETRDPKLVDYKRLVQGLIKEFDDITFSYLPRDENQMADALATLASIVRVNKNEDMKPIQMSIYEAPAHCYNIEEKEKNDHPWYHNILRYVKNHEYPDQATENDKRTLRRLACDYVLNGEILYKRGKDHVLLRCVDAAEAKTILEEVHEGVCGTHANGFKMARQIMRFGYYWSTMERNCIDYAEKCHKCQIYGDKIHAPHSPLHVMTSPWPFSMWGMDVIRPISPKASNGHRFIFVVIDYFTKWVEALHMLM
ncbi:RNA-directed DNA polymerase (Reverse transcriptase), Ribonuclease H-like protein [Gossypium australe]|uniref:RNA-directed DNA polymerase n=1 Tax=Gossypium australe TaxID=47621 RepID=A0A5B6V8X9_9ROSI|nr:RNA-directed DNA polymerase (Reverse transcriptase), Ribonuclease H-like protein [Gossypium australe]